MNALVRKLVMSLTLVAFSGCMPRRFHQETRALQEEGNLPSFQVPADKDTWLFTWTFREDAKSEPGRFLASSLEGVAELNRNYFDFVEGVQAGYGIYFASDPVQSYSFGNTLVAVKAAREGTVGFQASRETSSALVRSAFPGLYYLWGGGSPFVGEFALVVRDAKLLRLDTAKAFGGKALVPFVRKSRFVVDETTSWEQAVEHFADVMWLIAGIGEGENSRNTELARFNPALIDESGLLNRRGILDAVTAEFYHGHEAPMKAFDSLLGPQLASERLPFCTKEMATANERARRFKTPCALSIFRQISNAMNGHDTSANPHMVGLTEALLILRTAGYLPQDVAPASFLDLGAALEAEFRRSGAAERAQEGVEAYRLLKKEFGDWSLQKWTPSAG